MEARIDVNNEKFWGSSRYTRLPDGNLPSQAEPVEAKMKAKMDLHQEKIFFSFGATAPIRALAYLHETFRFTSVY
jgi:hypothetical protein